MKDKPCRGPLAALARLTARRGGLGSLTIYTTGDVEEYALRARQVGLERVERVEFYPPMEL